VPDEAEQKAEAQRVEQENAAAAAQQKLSPAEPVPAPGPAAEAGTSRHQLFPRANEGKPRLLKSGECSLVGGDIAALKDCVDKFNR
jgi:hypothetical protein